MYVYVSIYIFNNRDILIASGGLRNSYHCLSKLHCKRAKHKVRQKAGVQEIGTDLSRNVFSNFKVLRGVVSAV